ncbi:hypothetical protein DM01DRAFT_1331744, partial [Hesseltinella vesiculosa]
MAHMCTALPTELLDAILDLLNTCHQKQLRLVNRFFNRLITPRLFRVLVLASDAPQHGKHTGLRELSLLSHFSCLEFLEHLEQQQQSCPDDCIGQHVRSLKVLRTDLSRHDIYRFMQLLPSVTSFTLHSSVLEKAMPRLSSQHTALLAARSPELIELMTASFLPILGERHDLRHLELTGIVYQPLLNVLSYSILPYMSHLRSLDLGLRMETPELTPEGSPSLDYLHRRCPCLESLVWNVSHNEYCIIDSWKDIKTRGGNADNAIVPWQSVTDLWLTRETFAIVSAEELGQLAAFICIKFPRVRHLSVLFDSSELSANGPGTLTQTLMDPSLGCFRQLEALTLECSMAIGVGQQVFSHFAPAEYGGPSSLTIELFSEEDWFDFLETLTQFPNVTHLCTKGIGCLAANLDGFDSEAPLLKNSLTTIDMEHSWPAHTNYQGHRSALIAIGRLCPSLQHFKFSIEAWDSTIQEPDGVAYDLKKYAEDKIVAGAPCDFANVHVVSLPDFIGLSSLDIVSFSCHTASGMLFIAEVALSSTTAGICLTSLQAWHLHTPSRPEQSRAIRPLGCGTPPELDCIAEWIPRAGASLAATAPRHHFNGALYVVVLKTLPKQLFFDSQYVPCKPKI